jgi:hypothetical protein
MGLRHDLGPVGRASAHGVYERVTLGGRYPPPGVIARTAWLLARNKTCWARHSPSLRPHRFHSTRVGAPAGGQLAMTGGRLVIKPLGITVIVLIRLAQGGAGSDRGKGPAWFVLRKPDRDKRHIPCQSECLNGPASHVASPCGTPKSQAESPQRHQGATLRFSVSLCFCGESAWLADCPPISNCPTGDF